MLVAACAAPDPSPSIVVASAESSAAFDVMPPPAERGDWTVGGQIAPADIIALRRGPDHCGWHDLTILAIGWPIGLRMRTSETAREYVRDPAGLASSSLIGPFDGAAVMPGDAKYSGFSYGTDELWLAADVERFVYIVRGSVIERWARAPDLLACA
jgi:hypothetical protein